MRGKLIALFIAAAASSIAIPTISVGELTISVTSGNTAVLMLQLKQTSDLSSEEWQDAGDALRWEIPMDGNTFFKV